MTYSSWNFSEALMARASLVNSISAYLGCGVWVWCGVFCEGCVVCVRCVGVSVDHMTSHYICVVSTRDSATASSCHAAVSLTPWTAHWLCSQRIWCWSLPSTLPPSLLVSDPDQLSTGGGGGGGGEREEGKNKGQRKGGRGRGRDGGTSWTYSYAASCPGLCTT